MHAFGTGIPRAARIFGAVRRAFTPRLGHSNTGRDRRRRRQYSVQSRTTFTRADGVQRTPAARKATFVYEVRKLQRWQLWQNSALRLICILCPREKQVRTNPKRKMGTPKVTIGAWAVVEIAAGGHGSSLERIDGCWSSVIPRFGSS